MGKKFNGSRRSTANWVSQPKENDKWEAYYKEQGVIELSEWDEFKKACQTDLPLTFRVTGAKTHTHQVQSSIENEYVPLLRGIVFEGKAVQEPTPLPFYPNKLAWQVKVGKQVIRKNKPFARFQRFLVVETDVGNISRQEAVSMIPPLLLQVQGHHKVLDMCAAPGSKTAQLVEALHTDATTNNPITEPTGFVMANDSDYKRSHMLIHQVKRLNSSHFIVTNHDAQLYPKVRRSTASSDYIRFDRILCDVPCSGDGTMRKNINVWKDWNVGNALGLHNTQVNILIRGIQLLEPEGRLVYSTCSLNPIENEAVVAEALRRNGSSVELESISLPGLISSTGLEAWKVQAKDSTWQSRENSELATSLFPPLADELETMNLKRCIRVYPHQQDTGGFFIAVFRKKPTIKRPTEDVSHSSAKKVCLEVESPQPSPRPQLQIEPQEANTLPVDEIQTTDCVKATPTQETVSETPNLEANTSKKLPRDVNEEPFIFLDPSHETLESCWKFYGITPDYARNSLLVRNSLGEPVRTIYYVAPVVKELMQANESRLKFVHAGIKLFAQQKNDGSCKWRVQSEGVDLIFPHVSDKRIVRATTPESLKLLCLNSFPKIEELNSLDPELEKQIHKLDEGCAFLELKSSSSVYPIWRGRGSVNLMLPKQDLQEVLHRVFAIEHVKGAQESTADAPLPPLPRQEESDSPENHAAASSSKIPTAPTEPILPSTTSTDMNAS